MRSIGAMAGQRLPQRIAAVLAGLGQSPHALVWQPAPPTGGAAAAARRLAAGVFLFDGRLVDAVGQRPWDLTPPDEVWAAHLHGHGWLDDAAVCDDKAVWAALSGWSWEWLARYGTGQGIGWRPDLVARRLTRQIAHSVQLLNGRSPAESKAFFRALGRQARFLEWRWRRAPRGAARIEALVGRIYALISLEGTGHAAARAIDDLGREAETLIGPDGGVPSRNPEELARIAALLTWSVRSITDADLTVSTETLVALRRLRPTLAALRHGDGSLIRFHGGRGGDPEQITQTLHHIAGDASTPRTRGPVMGYVRLTQGDAVALIDGAPPPGGMAARTAHASALALEFSHGGVPIVVNCGSGVAYGDRAASGARQSTAHSTVALAGHEPATFAERAGDRAPVLQTKGTVRARSIRDGDGVWALCESLQYRARFGLTLERRLHLSGKGERLAGEDTAIATCARSRALAGRASDAPLCVSMRLHLHPGVKAVLALSGRAVSLVLPDGAHWLMQADADSLSLEPSQYFEAARPRPRQAQQIIATTALVRYWARISWSLERLPDSGLGDGLVIGAAALHAERT